MKIVKRNGYIYEVEGHGGFETYHTLGKDPNDKMWKAEIEIIEKEDDIIEIKSKKGKKTKKSED